MPYASELVALIDADTRRFDQKAAGVDRTLKKLASSDPEVTVSVDDTRAQADIRSVEAALTGIEDQTVGISADASDARSEVQTVEAALAGIEDETVGISADAAQARGEVQGVSAALAAIGDETVAVTANAAQARAEVQTVEAALAGIEDQDVRVTADTRTAAANVQSLEAALAGLEDQTVKVTTETQNAGTAAMGFGSRVGGAVANVGALKAGVAGLAGGAAAGGFYKLGQGALELRDTVNATNVVFGESRAIIDDWAQNSVDRVGLSERAFRDLSAPLGALMRSLGAVDDEVANMSTEVISLGADFASVLGGSTEEAVMAIGAAFRGETEPIRRYGITLDAAAVQERALSMGLVDSTGKIKNRAAVVRDLIVEQATANGIVGDFNRTQGEGVNALREAGAALEDAKNAWGELFAPAVEAGANALRQAAEASEYVIGPLQTVHGWLDKIDIIDFGHVTGGLETVGRWLGLVGDEAEGAEGPVRELSAEQYNLAESARTGRDATGGLAGAMAESKVHVLGLGDEFERTADEVDQFKDAIDRALGVQLSAEEAGIRYRQALRDLHDEVHTGRLEGESLAEMNDRLALSAIGVAEKAAVQTEALARAGDISSETGAQADNLRYHLDQVSAVVPELKGRFDRYGETVDTVRTKSDNFTRTLENTGGSAWRTRDVFGFYGARLGETGAASDTAKGKTEGLKGAVDVSGSAAIVAGGKFGAYKVDILNVPNDKTTNVHTPGLGPAVEGMGKLAGLINGIGRSVVINLKSSFGFGDGPGNIRAAGSAMARARAAATGLPVRMTSGYRTPARNRAVGGSPTSYHMDAGNPASDWVGPTWALDELARRLRAAGGFRELLWRVPNHAPGDNPHVHYAHTGGIVDPSWATLPGLRNDERPVIAQVGEGILSRSDMAALASSGGSSAPVMSTTFAPIININIPANAPDAATVGRLAYDAAKAGTAEAFAEERRRNLAMNGRR